MLDKALDRENNRDFDILLYFFKMRNEIFG